MTICVMGLSNLPPGRHNLKDARLDEVDRLVEAKKKVYAQVEVVAADGLQQADVILAHRDAVPDLILGDLEFVETRLSRDPAPAERAALLRLQAALESEKTVLAAGLDDAEREALAAHQFQTNRPVVVAEPGEAEAPEALLLRAFAEGGFICFLTVGGKENRAWPIRRGITAWEAAGSIHSDLQKGFIRAEIISHADFIAAGGETEAKRAGKLRLETKSYLVQDYDLVNFRFNK